MRELTITRQSVLLAAIEDTWQAIRGRHPDLPAVAIILGTGGARAHRGKLALGHFAPERWIPTGARDRGRVHEVLISAEGLTLGPTELLHTLLHESAHALARARGIADTSRQGRYHNHHFAQRAREVGLDTQYDPIHGHAHTGLPAHTAQRYREQITLLRGAIHLTRSPEVTPDGRPGRSGLTAATCRCPRRIRIAPSVLAAGPINCTNCHSQFTPTPALNDTAATTRSAGTPGGTGERR